MYCKYLRAINLLFMNIVLIVAKCIVNEGVRIEGRKIQIVLIVAKCIVNYDNCKSHFCSSKSINSSKVYCKFFIV